MDKIDIDKLNDLLQQRKLSICGPIFKDSTIDECFDYYIEVIGIEPKLKLKLKVIKSVTEEQTDTIWNIIGRILNRKDLHLYGVFRTGITRLLKNFGIRDFDIDKWEFVKPSNTNEMIHEQKVSRKFLRNIVRDIIFNIKKDYRKPKTYKYDRVDAGFGNPFDMEIIMNKGKDFDGKFLKPYDIEAFWDDDTDTLEVFLNIDPKTDQSFLYDLVGEFNDVISHELTHKRQYERGDKISKRRITRPETYYTQPHEVEAQMVGFKRKAKLMRKPLEDIIRDYFNKRRTKYNLNDKIIDRIVKKLMEHG
jgi:hypothetical protein